MEQFTGLGRISYLRFTPWDRVPGLCQGITARDDTDGHAQAGDKLNLLIKNLSERGFSCFHNPFQAHGSKVVPAEPGLSYRDDRNPVLVQCCDADGIAGCSRGSVGLISVADCVPVFMLDEEKQCWALLHAGWRGIAAGILEEGVGRLEALSGTPPRKLEMYLGPAVCGRCYQVGAEVAAALEVKTGKGKNRLSPETSKTRIDLRAVLASRAVRVGIAPENIRTSKYCTLCHNSHFHSWRAEGSAALGRMWAFMGFTAKA